MVYSVLWKWVFPNSPNEESRAARVRWNHFNVLFSTVRHEKYLPIWKRDSRTGQSSKKGKTMSFQLVFILVCLSVCLRDGVSLNYTQWIFFFSFFVDSIKCLLVLVPAACLFWFLIKVKVCAWLQGGGGETGEVCCVDLCRCSGMHLGNYALWVNICKMREGI